MNSSKFNTLLDEHRRMLEAYARALLREDPSQLDRVIDEACINAQDNWEEFDASKTSFAVWIRAFVPMIN